MLHAGGHTRHLRADISDDSDEEPEEDTASEGKEIVGRKGGDRGETARVDPARYRSKLQQ